MHVVAAESGFVTAAAWWGARCLCPGGGFRCPGEGRGRVAVVFFGDGAGQGGPFHESLNIASCGSFR